MYILLLRTDQPEAEIALYEGNQILKLHKWQAHRQLAETIHKTIDAVVQSQNLQLADLHAIAVWKGPGSFTGLRIGLSVANALAASLKVPIVGTTGSDWQSEAVALLENGENQQVVMPEYGAPVHITTPRK